MASTQWPQHGISVALHWGSMGTEHEKKGNCPTVVRCLLQRSKNVELLLLHLFLK